MNLIKYLHILILFTYSFSVIAQGNLSGNVMTLDNNPIPNAMVQLIKGGDIIAYTTTKVDGVFLLKYTELGNYTIEVNAFNFEKLVTDIIISNNELKVVELKLFPETKKLDEVTVLGKSSAMKEDGDKISYNLGAFTNGSEKTLKDVINKLPGMEVDSNGKIKVNGKVVDNLLIDGQEFFGENHQLATENISAEMIDGIDLLNHFENNSNIKDIESSDKKALNIAIKKDFKGKIKGNLSALSGYENRYYAKTNLFLFDKKSNFSFIGNINNTNEQTLSIEEYINMNNSIKNEIKNNDITNFSAISEIPTSLIDNDNIADKKTTFGAINFSVFPSPNFKINGFSIVNENIQNEITENTNQFIQNPQYNSIENIKSNADLLFNQTKINFDYKLNSKSYLSYSFLFDPRIDKTNRLIEQNQNESLNLIREDNALNKKTAGHQISYINRFANNKLLTLNVFSEIKYNLNNYFLDASTNLFSSNSKTFYQNSKFKTNENGIVSKLAIKSRETVYIQGIGYNSYNQEYISLLNYSEFNTENKLMSSRNNFSADFGFYKRSGKFQYTVLNKFKYFNSFSKETKLFFVPQIQLKYEFKTTHYIATTYNRSVKFADENKLFNNTVIQNYTTLYQNSNILQNSAFTNSAFGLNYLFIHLFTGTIAFASINYDNSDYSISQNYIQKQNYTEINNTLAKNQKNLSMNLNFERRIKFIKSRIKTEFTFSKNFGDNFLSNIKNPFISKIYFSKISLISKFKQNIFNYTCGFEMQKIETNYLNLNLNNQSKNISLFVNFEGKMNKKITYNFDNSYQSFKAMNSSRQFLKTDFEFAYTENKSNWKYFIKGNDIFNISSNQIIETALSNNLQQNKKTNRFPGFIAIGMKYNL